MDEILARAGIFQGVEPSAVSALTKQLLCRHNHIVVYAQGCAEPSPPAFEVAPDPLPPAAPAESPPATTTSEVVEAAASKFGIDLKLDHFDWSCDNYDRIGKWMPDDWKERIGGHDCIFFGASGWPARVLDHVSLWDSLIKFRREFDQYVNLRPVKLPDGVATPLAGKNADDIDSSTRPTRASRSRTIGLASSAGSSAIRRRRCGILRKRPPSIPDQSPKTEKARCALPFTPGFFNMAVENSDGQALLIPWLLRYDNCLPYGAGS